MRIISEARFKDFMKRHAASVPAMTNFVKLLRTAAWTNIQEVRAQFPHADLVTVRSGRIVTVFNIGGGNYRVVLRILYAYRIAYVLTVMTHAEYSKDSWKDRL